MHLRVNCKKHWPDNAPVTWDGNCYQCLREAEFSQDKSPMPRQIEDYFVDVTGPHNGGISLTVSCSSCQEVVTLTLAEAQLLSDQLATAVENISNYRPFRGRIHLHEGLLED